MTNKLVSREPYAMDNLFDDLLKGYFVRPMLYRGEMPEMRLRIDVKEDDTNYTVHAEMPGVAKQDIQVDIDGNMVSISAEVKRETERKDSEKLVHSERYYGKVARSFSLGQEVDEARATAKFDNGVLELTLPKKADAAMHRLTIQ
jgi:HSP20 family protein